MNRAWICIRCDRVYAPFIFECNKCNKKIEEAEKDKLALFVGQELRKCMTPDSNME